MNVAFVYMMKLYETAVSIRTHESLILFYSVISRMDLEGRALPTIPLKLHPLSYSIFFIKISRSNISQA
jgi:hypothetical protein